MKPLKGVDQGLRENLKSFFEIQYPEFEIIFCVADRRDQACQLLDALFKEYPAVSARLVISSEAGEFNPKVQNLIAGYELAIHDWILVSDSNIRADRSYLFSLAQLAQNHLGVLTSIVSGRDAENFSAQLEAIYLNTFYARWMLLSHKFNVPCVIGKSMLFRKTVIERFGGFKTLSVYLAEDYMTGVAMRLLGLKILISRAPVIQHLSSLKFSEFWQRHLRWGRIRKAHAPIAFFLEPLVSCFGSLGFGLMAAPRYTQYLIPLHLIFWAICDYGVAKKMDRQIHPGVFFSWIAREILSVPLWIHTAIGNSVLWRGRRVQLEQWGTIATAGAV